MYRDFDEMCELGKTPMEYGLKVRDSVEGMVVTSPNRMRSATRLKIGFAGGLSPSTSIFADNKNAKANLDAVNKFVIELDSEKLAKQGVKYGLPSTQKTAHHLWRNVPGLSVAALFDEIRTPENAYRVNSQLIARFIRGRVSEGQLVDWTVLIASPGENPRSSTTIGSREVRHSERRMPTQRGADREFGISKPTDAAWTKLVHEGLYTVKTVLSPSDELVDLSTEQVRSALSDTLTAWEKDGMRSKKPSIPSGVHIRKARPAKNGLLMIYIIDSPVGAYQDQFLSIKTKVEITKDPLVGFAVSFPSIEGAPAEDYVVTKTFMNEIRGFDEIDEDVEDDS